VAEKILVVDDDQETLELFARLIEQDTPCKVETCRHGEAALAKLKEEDIALVIADYRMPGMNGLELLRKTREIIPDQLFTVITGHATIEIVVEAMKAGAFDFITKPIGIDQVLFSIQRAIDWRKLKIENILLRKEVTRTKRPLDIVGESDAIKEVLTLIGQVIQTTSTVLIIGESGTGKELVARTIHEESLRRNQRFITIDWGTMPESLIESELFGHRKGAYTGATTHKRGLLSEADGGTVFLDEIGDIPLSIQAKLLRFIQEGEFKPIGSLQTQQVDARIVAATNKDLEALIQEGMFREDLFYRLNVFRIEIPPLRDRGEDIPLLARHFLRRYSSQLHKQIREIVPETIDLLKQHHWPGNVRELENVIERAAILCRSATLMPENLNFFIPQPRSPGYRNSDLLHLPYQEAREQTLQEFNQFYLGNVLKENNGNITRAARTLDMKRQTLQYLVKKHEVSFTRPNGNNNLKN
jgi:DNA-binding NtrC family response regulator